MLQVPKMHLQSESWLRTSAGVSRGYIDAHGLEELWFHTGTRCNLACPFCLEGSSPSADRLDYLSLEEVLPFFNEAKNLGVKQFSFTGGEPFLNKDMLPILKAALAIAPCMVLTNGTKPLLKKLDEIVALQNLPHALQFRISIDHPDEVKHDQGRGKGNFKLALESMAQLQKLGFKVSLARHAATKEDKAVQDRLFREVMLGYGIDVSKLNIVAFPDFLTPGAVSKVPEITNQCMTTYQNLESRRGFMCAYSRMVIKRSGRVQVSACTLVDDDPDYDLASTLTESLETRVMLRHHRCFSCFSLGASCSERNHD